MAPRGRNFPPQYKTAPYFSETFGQIGERAARDAKTRKTYYVPDDMKYKDRKAVYIDTSKTFDKWKKENRTFASKNNVVLPSFAGCLIDR